MSSVWAGVFGPCKLAEGLGRERSLSKGCRGVKEVGAAMEIGVEAEGRRREGCGVGRGGADWAKRLISLVPL